MNFSLPKNRITPIIIFAILSLFASLILGLYQINKISQYSYSEKLNSYDKNTMNVISIIKEEIKNTYHAVEASADLIGKIGNQDKDHIQELLVILANSKSFVDISYVNMDGQGFNLTGEVVDVSDESYFIDAKKGKVISSDEISFTKDNIPVITIAAPINSKVIKGEVIAKVRAQNTDLVSLQSEVEQGSQICIINQNNDLIMSLANSDVKEFDYNKIVSNGFFRSSDKVSVPKIGLKELFTNYDVKEASYIWERTSLGLNNWYVLIGRTNHLSPVTKKILNLTNLLWSFITIVMILLFGLMIYIQRRSNQKVIKMLYIDPVTGGGNWYRFRNTVSKILSSRQFGKKNYALINFDINRFKTVNDVYGYQKGDEVLKDIYIIIKRWAKLDEPFTRYAADEFYILMNYQKEEEINNRLKDLNDRLHQLHYTTTARITFGVYNITEFQDSVDRMGEFASIAKDKNKNSTEGIIFYFDDAAKSRLIEEERIENTMHEALIKNEFHVFLQPKYMATGEEILGAEALVRWITDSGNVISPGYFIPIFEKNGFIKKLDFYMLKKVCSLLKEWLDKGYSPMPVSVNISRLHFANPRLSDIITSIVDDYNVPHNLIELELTESAFLQNKQLLIETVISLRSRGFIISMDDFGAGYSSLNSLKDLPLDVVKLDGELFRMTNEIERGLTVIRNTITMAKDLHMKVVAECIETKEQAEYLCAVGCDIIQGYCFAKPMPVDQFEQKYLVKQINA